MSSITDLCKRINEDLATSVATKTFWTTKIMVNGDKCVYRDYPEIEVEYEDLINMFDENSYSEVIGKLRKPVVEPPVVEASVQSEVSQTPIPATRDMLATTVIPKIDENTVVNEAPEEEKAEVTSIAPVESIERAPMKKTKKPLNMQSRPNSQAGFAEVIALGVVVLVYIVIIVNLIIRLK